MLKDLAMFVVQRICILSAHSLAHTDKHEHEVVKRVDLDCSRACTQRAS